MLVCHCIFSVTINVHSHFRRFSGLHWLQVIFSLIATWSACLPLFFHYLQLGLAVCHCFFTVCYWMCLSATDFSLIAARGACLHSFFTNCNLECLSATVFSLFAAWGSYQPLFFIIFNSFWLSATVLSLFATCCAVCNCFFHCLLLSVPVCHWFFTNCSSGCLSAFFFH